MLTYTLLFAVFALLLVAAVGFMTLTRNLIYAGFGLFFALTAVAALFVMAGADFPALAQIIVYVGGILVLLLFGVMLSQRETGPMPATPVANFLPALGLCLLLGGGIVWAFRKVDFGTARPLEAHPAPDGLTQVAWLGKLLLTDYLVAFELASVLLLLALIGAAYLTRYEQPQHVPAPPPPTNLNRPGGDPAQSPSSTP